MLSNAYFFIAFVISGHSVYSSQYLLDKENTLYGGISQAYRPVIFKDIVPALTYEQIYQNLKDQVSRNRAI